MKAKANAMDGKVSSDMSRVVVKPRVGYKQTLRKDGLDFYDLPGLKWVKGQMIDPDDYWTEEGAI